MNADWSPLARLAKKAGNSIARFRVSECGNVAMIFGLLAIPLMVMLGGAVDFMRFNRHKTELLAAMDSAALAVAQQSELSDQESKEFDTNYINAMVTSGSERLFTVDDFIVTKTASGIVVDSQAEMETAFLPLIGIETMPLNFSTEVEASTNYIELALALDNTGSMRSNGKIGALRDAATSLVDIMYESATADSRTPRGRLPEALGPFPRRPLGGRPGQGPSA